MYLKWKKRLDTQSEYRDLNNWPYIDPNVLPKNKQGQYIRNRKIIAKVLKGLTLQEISEEFGISSGTISYLLNRSLGGDDREIPQLTTALIPGNVIKDGKRVSELSQIGSERGTRGAFEYLLNTVEGLNNHLDELLNAFIKKSPFSQNLTPQIFHKEFLRYLHDVNWPTTTYPFDQNTLAYESCRKYFHKRTTELSLKTSKKERILKPLVRPNIAYDEIQIDEQKTDISTSIYIEVNGNFHALRLSRLSLYLVKDVATDCNLSYHLCYTKDPNQSDVLEALESIHRKWEPLELNTPGLSYTQGACLPSAVIDHSHHIGLNLVRMDNALCHLAHSVREYICNKLNATLNFGLPAHPKGRNYIEHGFDVLGDQIHRFASTTGSHAQSPIKETKKNYKKPPLITLSALEEILSILITHHNVQPQMRLGGKSPLEVLKKHVSKHYITYSFDSIDTPPKPHCRQKEVSIKHLKSDNRRPHINFEGLRYTGNCLTSAVKSNSKVYIEYDDRDIRSLKVFSKKGKELGMVYAPRTWQSHPHSTKTRKQIFKITKKLRLAGNDPLSGYFDYLLKNKELPKTATELIRITKEFGQVNLSINQCDDNNDTMEIAPISHPRPRFIKPVKIPAWSPEIDRIPMKDNYL